MFQEALSLKINQDDNKVQNIDKILNIFSSGGSNQAVAIMLQQLLVIEDVNEYLLDLKNKMD